MSCLVITVMTLLSLQTNIPFHCNYYLHQQFLRCLLSDTALSVLCQSHNDVPLIPGGDRQKQTLSKTGLDNSGQRSDGTVPAWSQFGLVGVRFRRLFSYVSLLQRLLIERKLTKELSNNTERQQVENTRYVAEIWFAVKVIQQAGTKQAANQTPPRRFGGLAVANGQLQKGLEISKDWQH